MRAMGGRILQVPCMGATATCNISDAIARDADLLRAINPIVESGSADTRQISKRAWFKGVEARSRRERQPIGNPGGTGSSLPLTSCHY
jgi:hypothetical protein